MKSDLRSIVVDGERYLWTFNVGVRSSGSPQEPIEAEDEFVAYLESERGGLLRISFASYTSVFSSPLGMGLSKEPGGRRVYLDDDAAIVLIRHARQHGWQPGHTRDPHVVKYDMELLDQLGLIKPAK